MPEPIKDFACVSLPDGILTFGGVTINGLLTRNCYKITNCEVKLQCIVPFVGSCVSVTNSTFDTVFVYQGSKCYKYHSGLWTEDAF